jgi:diguanylate cyclase (GGDEF)-like protein
MISDNSILFYTDFNCPFCYALNERLITLGDKSRIQWRGIEHDPAVSSQSTSLADKNKLIIQVNMIRKRAQEIQIVTHLLNSQCKRKLADCRNRIYRALWLQGKDISDIEILRDIVEQSGLNFPTEQQLSKPIEALNQWQEQWTGERFKSRLPVLVSVATDKPLLGFPTHELLQYFFNGLDFPLAPETLAACQLKPKQSILVVGRLTKQRCDLVELETPYHVVYKENLTAAQKWLDKEDCPADLILLDHLSLGQQAFNFCSQLKKQKANSRSMITFLLDKLDAAGEMQAFDVGASDVFFDLSNPKVAQARLDAHLRTIYTANLMSAMARMDHLTELANRGEFDRRLEEEWYSAVRSGLPLSVALFDIDHFKSYNDHYGHQVGDDCLRQVAKAMSAKIHRATDFIARYGGEEFVVILAQTDNNGAFKKAQQLRTAVESLSLPHQGSPLNPLVTISGGVATLYPQKDQDPASLLALADKALYQAKANGRNCIA